MGMNGCMIDLVGSRNRFVRDVAYCSCTIRS